MSRSATLSFPTTGEHPRHAFHTPPQRRLLGHQDHPLLHRADLHLVGSRHLFRTGQERGGHRGRRGDHDERAGRGRRRPRENVPRCVRTRLHAGDGQGAQPEEAGDGLPGPAEDRARGGREDGVVGHGRGSAAEIAAVPAFQQDGQFRRNGTARSSPTTVSASPSSRLQAGRDHVEEVEGLLAAGALVPETEAKELFRVASRKIRLLVVTADPEKRRPTRRPRGKFSRNTNRRRNDSELRRG